MTERKSYYITTPIYYPSDYLHIGHTYCTVATDTVKKYLSFLGNDVFFTTGSDEHGQKIEQKAKESGMGPKEYVDKIVEGIKELWEMLEIDYDAFIRSTDDHHVKAVQNIFQRLYDKGEIYKSHYEGHYCTPCESFWTDSQLLEGELCPDCGRATHLQKEEAYFFRLSKYRDRILELYRDNPAFILPDSRKNEMINNFLKEGLEDLSVSRSTLDWGIKVPFDDKHVIYVWIDALSCYLTALGYDGINPESMGKFWPAHVHFVGKEIVRFHTIIWPAILMALELPLPDRVFGHGWILFDDDKMSKSKGNVVYPEPIIELYGIDAFKYFLLREFTFGSDGSFNKEKFLQRLNSDLANDLGNLVSRTVSMIEKYDGGTIYSPKGSQPVDLELSELAVGTAEKVEELMHNFNFSYALEEIWKLVRRSNKYVDETMPWVLAKENPERLKEVLYNLAESLRVISVLIYPFMGKTSEIIREQLGLIEPAKWEDAKNWGLIKDGTSTNKGNIIFPRLDIEVELGRLTEANQKLLDKRLGKKTVEAPEEKPQVTIDDFAKLQFVTGTVLSCENHPKADKLYVIEVDLGYEKRTIVSGLKDWYEPTDIVGKQVIVIANLKPAKLRGIESRGMLLAAEDQNGELALLTTLNEVENGASVS
ncbi:MAG: methionine--tRNA ligase [Tissierellia bacterium]|nr:methionine--tRNA ligase [Tissierellia bacterium]